MNWREHNAPYFWDEEKDTQIVQVTCLRPPSKKQGEDSITNISTTISGFLSAHLYVFLNPGKTFLNPEECSRGARTVALGAPYWPMLPVIRSFRFEFKCSRCYQLISFYSTYLEKEFWIEYGNVFKLICIIMHNNIKIHAPRWGWGWGTTVAFFFDMQQCYVLLLSFSLTFGNLKSVRDYYYLGFWVFPFPRVGVGVGRRSCCQLPGHSSRPRCHWGESFAGYASMCAAYARRN